MWYVDAIFSRDIAMTSRCHEKNRIDCVDLCVKYELEIFTGNSWKSTGILFSWFVRHPAGGTCRLSRIVKQFFETFSNACGVNAPSVSDL